jgi:hypothetical protein
VVGRSPHRHHQRSRIPSSRRCSGVRPRQARARRARQDARLSTLGSTGSLRTRAPCEVAISMTDQVDENQAGNRARHPAWPAGRRGEIAAVAMIHRVRPGELRHWSGVVRERRDVADGRTGCAHLAHDRLSVQGLSQPDALGACADEARWSAQEPGPTSAATARSSPEPEPW